MKKIIIILFLFPCFLSAQRLDVKDLSGTKYLIRQDTLASGVITITRTPLILALDQFNEQISDVSIKIAITQDAIKNQQAYLKELQMQLSQLNALKKAAGF
jgi:hypothetical protein